MRRDGCLGKAECCSPYLSVLWWDASVLLLLRGRYEMLWHPAGCLEQPFSLKIQLWEKVWIMRQWKLSVCLSGYSPTVDTEGVFGRPEGIVCMAHPVSFQSRHTNLSSIFHLFFALLNSHLRGLGPAPRLSCIRTVFPIDWDEVLTEMKFWLRECMCCSHFPTACLFAQIHGLFHVIHQCVMHLLAHPPDPFLLAI